MAALAPVAETITRADLDRDPCPIHRRLRAEAPVLRVKAAGRTLLTKAADTKYVKDNPGLFSSEDPNTPVKRAFWAHTLMRKDGDAHKRERMAMARAFARADRANEGIHALNTAVVGLLENPDQLAEVKKNSDLDKAFEEAVRWVQPIQASSRLVTEDTESRGCAIPKGDTVMTIQASATRDDEIFSNGERFDVYRASGPHQAFGNGPHFCRGTHVARRAVGRVMLPLLFNRFPNMRLPDPSKVIWSVFGFRGPITVPVELA